MVGFANPLLYCVGSQSNGTDFRDAINQIIAPTTPVALLRGYAANLNEARVVTVNSVPFLIITAPYALEVCGLPLCLGLNDVWNWTSLSLRSGAAVAGGLQRCGRVGRALGAQADHTRSE